MSTELSERYADRVRNFREAAREWNALAPTMTTVSSPGGPMYCVSELPHFEEEWVRLGWWVWI
jgi:hypothetical protein